MAVAGFGKAKLGGGEFLKNFKLETPKSNDESTVALYRILPPIHQQVDTGKWSIYVAQHFGYRGRDKKDETKLRNRPFKCVLDKNFKTGMVKQTCPACTKRDEVKAQQEAAEAMALKSGLSPEKVKEMTGTFATWLKDHNVDFKIKMFVANEQGEVGELSISNKCNKQLMVRIKELRDMDIDPFDVDQGVYFAFKRSGHDFNQIVDTVEIATVMERDANGKPTGRQSYKFAPLSPETQMRALQTLPDLTELVTTISREKIQMIVDSDGDPDVVDAAFEGSERVRPQAPAQSYTQTVNLAAAAAALANTHAQSMAPTPPPVVEKSAPNELELLKARLAELEAMKTTPTPSFIDTTPVLSAAQTSPPPAPTPKVNAADLSDEAFNRTFGIKTA